MSARTSRFEGSWVTTFSSDLPVSGSDLEGQGEPSQARHRNLGRGSKRRLTGVLQSGFGTDAGTRAGQPRRARARRTHGQYPHVLSHELFADALARERRRAARFEEPFTLVTVELEDACGSPGTAAPAGEDADRRDLWREATAAFAVVSGGTSLLGWIADYNVLGAIVPDVVGPNTATLFRRELTRRLGKEAADHFSVASHACSPALATAAAEPLAAPTFPTTAGPRGPAGYPLKRPLDVVGSLALLVLLSPLFLLVTLLMKLTAPGSVLFRQTRVGQLGKPFTMFKFRTMHVDADEKLHQVFVQQFIRPSAAPESTGRKPLYKLTQDPRITRLGRVLRKTSLDELPQLWNVLRGDMSLVGPRPPLGREGDLYRPWHWRRVLEAKPGLTGLWQVKGRSRTTFDQMVRLDLQYVVTCCLWTDVKIILATPWAVLSAKGAA